MQRPRVALAKFETWVEESGSAQAYREFTGLLRAAVPAVAPDRYRGISRFVLERYWDGEKQLPVELPDLAARTMIFDRLGPDPSMEYGLESFDADLLPDLSFAQEVLAATEHAADWEIVHVFRDAHPRSQRTLGFDAGYWGSSHFSLICDSLVMSRWHPPDPDDFEELRARAMALNEHVLFDKADDARAFRAWYLSKPWSETESWPGQFEVIRVDDVASEGESLDG